jgi:ribonuclease Z
VPSFAYSFSERVIENKLDVAKLASAGIAPGPEWGQLQQGNDITSADGRVLRAADYFLPPRKQRKIIVGGDNDRPDLLAAQAQAAEVLVHEATYTEDVFEKIGSAVQHSTAKRVAQFAGDAGIRNLVLTHFSPRYQDQKGKVTLSDIEAEARAVYTGNLFLANDLERYVLDRQGNLSRTS